MANPKIKGMAIVAMFMSPGVSKGGGGFVIINGKLKKIPPRGPKFKQMEAALQGIAKIR